MRKFLSLLFISTLLLACGAGFALAESEFVPVTGVAMTLESIRIKLDETATLQAVVEPANATNQTLVWTSDNEEVVTVDQNGFIAPVKTTGRANVVATTVDGGFVASCEVTIAPKTPLSTTFISAYATTTDKKGKLAPVVCISWNKSPARISGYQLRRSETPDGDQVVIKSGKIFSCEDTRIVKPGVTYYYYVYVYKTINAIRTYSEPSEPLIIKTMPRPEILYIEDLENKRANIHWDAIPEAECYDVYRSTHREDGFEKIGTAQTNSFIDEDATLEVGRQYFYKLVPSSFSDVAEAWVYGMPSNAYARIVR